MIDPLFQALRWLPLQVGDYAAVISLLPNALIVLIIWRRVWEWNNAMQ